MASQYAELAEALRERIRSGEFPVGSQLPGIAALQDEYGIRSLNTVRYAQQMLVEEGMLKTEQGRGAFVLSTESRRDVDVDTTLREARAGLDKAIAAIDAQRLHTIAIDLTDEAVSFVLVDALRDYAAGLEHENQDADPDAPGEKYRIADRQRWIEACERLLKQIDDA